MPRAHSRHVVLCLLACLLAGLGVVSGLPDGVKFGGVLISTAELKDGSKTIPTGSYVVGVAASSKTSILEEMGVSWGGWKATFEFEGTLSFFVGVLSQEQIVWLLEKESTLYIEEDGKVSIADGPPAGVTIGGTLITLEDLQSGRRRVPTNSYIVGAALENKAALLGEMDAAWDWAPLFALDALPLFAGVLSQTQIEWLLQREDVKYIEEDAKVSHTGDGLGTVLKRVTGELITAVDIQTGRKRVPTRSYIVLVHPESKAALLEELRTLLGWTPVFAYSSGMPMFAGVLDQDVALWLLQHAGVRGIEEDSTVTIAHGSSAAGVGAGGTLVAIGDLVEGRVEVPEGSYVVGVEVGEKTALLQAMDDTWGWAPTFPFSSTMPVFAGELDNTHVVWLLQREEVTSIEEMAFNISGPPDGVKINNSMVLTEDIQSGSREVPTGGYLVGIHSQLKEALLAEMSHLYSWTPIFAYSGLMPFFAGVMTQAQVLWLLAKPEVDFVEADGETTFAQPPAGVSIDGELITLQQIQAGEATVPVGFYLVTTRAGFKAALLEQMRFYLGWTPSGVLHFVPTFAGVLDQEEVVWLLGKAEVLYIETDVEVHANPPPGYTPRRRRTSTSAPIYVGAGIGVSARLALMLCGIAASMWISL